MTTEQLVLIVLGYAAQTGGLVLLGLMIYRQGRWLADALTRLGERVSPGEAAIILQQQRLMTRFEELRTPAPEGGAK